MLVKVIDPYGGERYVEKRYADMLVAAGRVRYPVQTAKPEAKKPRKAAKPEQEAE